MRRVYGEDATFVCGYEAGCFYHQLKEHTVDYKILAPTTMAKSYQNG